jgi:sodium/hydrogen antiporter
VTAVLVFAVVLVIAVLLSELADRSVLSTTVLFLIAGFVIGALFELFPVEPGQPVVTRLVEVVLFAVLFTDGMRVGLRELSRAWRLPGRALLFGMPLTFATIALLGHFVLGLAWGQSFLVGAVLSPTDPVFAAALVGREGVPGRLKRLLNVESGLNDGLALPVVLVLIALLRHSPIEAVTLVTDLLGGIVIGVVVPTLALKLEGRRFFSAAPDIAALFPFAIGLLVFAVASVIHANLFLAAFSAGVTVATVSDRFQQEFRPFGQLLSELLKVAAVLVFGALMEPSLLVDVGLSGLLFALLVLILARPVAIAVALLGSDISKSEWAAAAWFGPKGFASVAYALLLLQEGVVGGQKLFEVIAVAVATSIVLHSSTDVVVARQLRKPEQPA